MAEEFAFDKIFGKGPAIYGDEGFFRASAEVVDVAGDDFLSGTGFADDQRVRIAGRNEFEMFHQCL